MPDATHDPLYCPVCNEQLGGRVDDNTVTRIGRNWTEAKCWNCGTRFAVSTSDLAAYRGRGDRG